MKWAEFRGPSGQRIVVSPEKVSGIEDAKVWRNIFLGEVKLRVTEDFDKVIERLEESVMEPAKEQPPIPAFDNAQAARGTLYAVHPMRQDVAVEEMFQTVAGAASAEPIINWTDIRPEEII